MRQPVKPTDGLEQAGALADHEDRDDDRHHLEDPVQGRGNGHLLNRPDDQGEQDDDDDGQDENGHAALTCTMAEGSVGDASDAVGAAVPKARLAAEFG